MKTKVLLLFFTLSSFNSYSQTDCQEFSSIIQLIDSELNATPLDTNVISLCVGETLDLVAMGVYPNNNQTYEQSDMTSTYAWTIEAVGTFAGPLLEYQFNQGGIYFVAFSMTDIMGCLSPTTNLIVQVERPPNVVFSPELNIACPNQEVAIVATVTDSTYYSTDDVLSPANAPIPDGGSHISLPLVVDIFEEEQVLTSLSDLAYVRVNIEHSWLRDLEVKLVSPNGSSIILHEHVGNFGSGVWLGEPVLSDGQIPTPGIGANYYWKFGSNLPTWIEWADNNDGDGFETLPFGDYAAFEGIDSLLGSPLNGEWRLEIQDLWAQDNGFLFDWGLGFDPSLPRIVDNPVSFVSVVADARWLEHPQASIHEDTLTGFLSNDGFVYQVETATGCVFTYPYTVMELLNENEIECQACDAIMIDAGPDQMMACQNDMLTITPSINDFSDNFEYTWTIAGEEEIFQDGFILNISSPNTYVFHVTNPINGCYLTDTVIVEATTELPFVDAGEDIFSACLDPITLAGTASEGAEFFYTWSTLEGNFLTGTETLFPIVNASGFYVLTVINNITGCTASDVVEVRLGANIISGFETQSTECDSINGIATVLVQATSTDIQFLWSTGETTPSISNVAEGWYSVTVTEADCESQHQNVYVGEGAACNATIGGRVVLNQSGDCATGAIGVECIMIHLLPIDLYTYTDETGAFEFIVDAGNYTLEYIEEEEYNLLCPQSGTINIEAPEEGAIYMSDNFWVEPAPVQNLCISTSAGFARPGFLQNYRLEVCNWGEIPQDATLTFQHDSLFEVLNLPDLADDYDPLTYTASKTFPALAPGACQSFSFDLRVPIGTELGTILTQSAEVFPKEGDAFPANNNKTWQQEVRGSYDPNDKQSFTGTHQFGGDIYEEDQILDYQIRFQNTGTDTAFTVVIRDTLDATLNVRTIQAGQASHDYILEFEGNNVLIFNFENILLPDSTTNEMASHGYVTFRVERHENLPLGTLISNRAAIFFDYNAPIITNEVEHIVNETVAVELINRPSLEVFIAPNPTTSQTQVFYELDKAAMVAMRLYNAKGQLEKICVKEDYRLKGNHEQRIDLGGFASGMYWLCIEVEGYRTWRSLVLK